MTQALPNVQGPFQLFHPLSPAAYAALRDSIAERGCLVPVEISADGQILDGHHRVAACRELGIDYPRIVRAPMSPSEAIEHVISLHVHRRHLDREARESWIKVLSQDGWSTRRIAELTGLSQATVVRDLKRVGESSESPATVTGKDGRSYPRRRPTAVFAANTRQQNRARAAVTSLGPDAATGVIDIRRAERLAREHRNSQLAGIPSDPLPAGVRIDHCDFRELDIADASVDLILTDPPYTTASMDVWDDLGRLAARWLKPGAFLVAVSGQANLPRAMNALTAAGLDYWWSMAMLHGSGEVTQVRGRHLGSRFKLILVMRAPGGQTRPPWFVDTLNPSAKEKDLHPWQQSVAHFEYLVEHLSSPGNLVVDPFAGSGTTAIAALRAGRSTHCSEIDATTVSVARKRVLGAASRVSAQRQPNAGTAAHGLPRPSVPK